jgi:hypothetical protein
MSHTQTDPSQQSSSSPPAGPSTGAAVVDDDPLAKLHKMSTTAGLGSGDYVAVNGTAVFALLLGFASALTLLEDVLLILPLACVIASVVAWRQINHSNGTQTGKGLIVLGLAAALVCGGFVVARKATEGIRTREDRQAIGTIVSQWGQKIAAGDYDGAYAMFSERFQQSMDRKTFEERLGFVRENALYGKLKETKWNGLAEFQTDDATGRKFAQVKMTLYFEKTELPETVTLGRHEGKWLIENMPTIFPPARQPGQPAR